MFYSLLLRVFVGLMFLFAPAAVLASGNAAVPPDNILTHHNLAAHILPQPVSSFSASPVKIKTAGVYWLPDFLKANLGRTSQCQGSNCGGKDPDPRCAVYGYVSNCPAPKTSQGAVRPVPNLLCQKGCYCQSKYQYTTANCKESDGKKPSGTACDGKYDTCGCMPTVTLGAGEKCDLMCGGNCVKKSCKTGVSVGTGEQCNERCASNTSVCTAKGCKAGKTVGTGEQCTERCASNSSVCTAKGCKSADNPGTGEQCNEKCASNTSVCTAKGCKAGKTVGTGEQCTERCASNSSVCTAKGCKSADNPGTGEECKERCASNSSICTRSACKASVSVPSGYTCTEYCGSTCVGRGCVSTAGKRTCSCGGSGEVYSCGSYYYSSCYSCCSDTCSSGSKYVSCNSSQDKVKVSTTGCGSACYECRAKCANSCSLSSCPTGANCTRESCSGKYCFNSCKDGYQQNGSSCTKCVWKHFTVPVHASSGEGCGGPSPTPNMYYTGKYTWMAKSANYCVNSCTGQKNYIFTTSLCQPFGPAYDTLEECKAKEGANGSAETRSVFGTWIDRSKLTSPGINHINNDECKDANTTSWGSTSAAEGTCTL